MRSKTTPLASSTRLWVAVRAHFLHHRPRQCLYRRRRVAGVAGEGNTTRIRNIGSTPIVGGNTVVVAGTGGIGDGKLGYASSSRRYKQEIKPMEDASESLFALKPVTFRAKDATDDATRAKHYGLIAEEVATVNPDLVVFNPEGQPETLRFDSINAMLLNEFLKEHGKVEEQSCEIVEQRPTITELKKEIATVVAQLREQAAQIQKVSAQLEASKPAPQHGQEQLVKLPERQHGWSWGCVSAIDSNVRTNSD